MRKIIGALNMTLDGYCDHTAVLADDELHEHFSDLLKSGGVALYGRITYDLMKYWKEVVENPTGEKSTDEFALTMDQIPKIVFSRTLQDVDWESAKLAARDLREEALSLKQQPGKDILAGSRSIIIGLMNEGLLDEFQVTVHPVIAGAGLPFMDLIKEKTSLKLVKSKTFGSGAVTLYYEL